MRFCIILLLFAIGCLSSSAQVSVEASIDSSSILIGQQAHLHVRVSAPKGNKVAFPQYANGVITKGVEIVEKSPVDTVWINDGSRMELSRTYTITSFDSALYNIPRVQVEANGVAYSSPRNIGLKVGTVNVDLKHPEKFRDPKGVVPDIFKWNWALFAEAFGALALLVCFIVMSIRLTNRKPLVKRIVLPPPMPAHIKAMNAIERLKGENVASDPRLYYSKLTDTLRSYIQDRFGFNAREKTTSEIIDYLLSSDNKSALDDLREVLQLADWVKFAKYEANVGEADRSLLKAADFINTTHSEQPANPAPIVKEVELRPKKQIWLRRAYVAVWAVSLLAGLALVFVVINEIRASFF